MKNKFQISEDKTLLINAAQYLNDEAKNRKQIVPDWIRPANNKNAMKLGTKHQLLLKRFENENQKLTPNKIWEMIANYFTHKNSIIKANDKTEKIAKIPHISILLIATPNERDKLLQSFNDHQANDELNFSNEEQQVFYHGYQYEFLSCPLTTDDGSETNYKALCEFVDQHIQHINVVHLVNIEKLLLTKQQLETLLEKIAMKFVLQIELDFDASSQSIRHNYFELANQSLDIKQFEKKIRFCENQSKDLEDGWAVVEKPEPALITDEAKNSNLANDVITETATVDDLFYYYSQRSMF